MSLRMNTLSLRTLAAGALASALVGCNLTGAMEPPPAFPPGQVPATTFTPDSVAGLPVTPEADPAKLTNLVAKRAAAGSFGTARSDPFALTTQERYFETQQEAERLFGGLSPFSVQLTEKPQVIEEVQPLEPQPYRRLSGIVVGDSILAILEEEGKEPLIVTPGMRIPNSEWRVVSIDQDKAILRRSGSAKPSQVIVPLETPRLGTQPTGGSAGFPGQGGFPPGGGPPGGRGGGRGED